jgi:membrane protein implicated in regulation of membrane protease activity
MKLLQLALCVIIIILLICLVLFMIYIGAKMIFAFTSATGVWAKFVSVPLSTAGSLAVLVGALVALAVWIWNVLERERDRFDKHNDELLNKSNSFYEKAFETLNVLDETGRPRNERVRWLTSARLLKTAEKIGEKIESESHKQMYEEIVEYWRWKFYDLVQPDGEGFPSSYYAERPEDLRAFSESDREPLSLQSVAAIYRFTHWQEERHDPITNEAPFSEREIQRMLTLGPQGLGQLLNAYNRLEDRQMSE